MKKNKKKFNILYSIVILYINQIFAIGINPVNKFSNKIPAKYIKPSFSCSATIDYNKNEQIKDEQIKDTQNTNNNCSIDYIIPPYVDNNSKSFKQLAERYAPGFYVGILGSIENTKNEELKKYFNNKFEIAKKAEAEQEEIISSILDKTLENRKKKIAENKQRVEQEQENKNAENKLKQQQDEIANQQKLQQKREKELQDEKTKLLMCENQEFITYLHKQLNGKEHIFLNNNNILDNDVISIIKDDACNELFCAAKNYTLKNDPLVITKNMMKDLEESKKSKMFKLKEIYTKNEAICLYCNNWDNKKYHQQINKIYQLTEERNAAIVAAFKGFIKTMQEINQNETLDFRTTFNNYLNSYADENTTKINGVGGLNNQIEYIINVVENDIKKQNKPPAQKSSKDDDE